MRSRIRRRSPDHRDQRLRQRRNPPRLTIPVDLFLAPVLASGGKKQVRVRGIDMLRRGGCCLSLADYRAYGHL